MLLIQSLRTGAGGAAEQSTASRGGGARPLSHGARTLSLPTRPDRCRLV